MLQCMVLSRVQAARISVSNIVFTAKLYVVFCTKAQKYKVHG